MKQSKVQYDATQNIITVDDAAVRAALGALQSKTPAVLKVAVNATAREARRLMIKSARQRYALSAKGIEKVQGLKQRAKATNKSPTAELYIGGSSFGVRNDLAYFTVYPRVAHPGIAWKTAPKEGFHGKVLRSESMKVLSGTPGKSKGFLAEFSSGHVGMVQRVKGSKSQHDRTMRGYKKWEPNNKLQTLGSPSAVSMHHVVWKQVEPDVEEILQEKLERRISQVLARAGKVV